MGRWVNVYVPIKSVSVSIPVSSGRAHSIHSMCSLSSGVAVLAYDE